MDYVTYNILKHYNGLNERERFVVENRSQNTLKSLGEQIGVTPERVRQIEAKAYRKMIGRYIYFLQHEAEFREYLDIEKMTLGVTEYLWECETCHEIRKESLLGKETSK